MDIILMIIDANIGQNKLNILRRGCGQKVGL